MVAEGTAAEIVIDSWPFESKLGRGRTCTLAVSSWPKFDNAATPASMKVFSNYHNGRLGNTDARARGADWPVFLSSSGEVTESSGAGVAVVVDGELRLPDLSTGVLDSITRRTLCVLARELGVPVRVGSVQRTDLYLADEVFQFGTAAEVAPVVAVDGFQIGDGQSAGPITQRLETAYHDVVRGVVDNHDEWLTPIR
jgi:branched-chain amino acid aminotransferase